MDAKNATRGREAYAIAGMVFGIAAIPLLYPWPLSLISSAIGVILSLVGIKSGLRKLAILGLVCGLICLLVIAAATIQELFFMTPQPK